MLHEPRQRAKGLGQSTVELVTGIIIFVPIVLLLIDVALLAMSSTTNDSVCREAARAAAKVPPDQSQARAQQIVDAANKNAGSVANYTMTCIPTQDAITFNQNPPQQGGVVPGQVTVNTQCQVHPLTVLNVIDGGQPIKFTSTQTFPFTYVVPQNGSPN